MRVAALVGGRDQGGEKPAGPVLLPDQLLGVALDGRSGMPTTTVIYKRSKPRMRSQSVTDDSNAASSRSARCT